MSFIFYIILFVVIGTIVTGAIYGGRGRRFPRGGAGPRGQIGSGRRNEEALSPAERNILHLKVNDIVQHMGTDYIVKAKLSYTAEGFTWYSYLLEDVNVVKWLSVSEDEGLELALYDEVKDLQWANKSADQSKDGDGKGRGRAGNASDRPPDKLVYKGMEFIADERGQATLRREGQVLGARGSDERCYYVDYDGPNDTYLSIEKFGNDIEVFIGKDVDINAIDVLPAS